MVEVWQSIGSILLGRAQLEPLPLKQSMDDLILHCSLMCYTAKIPAIEEALYSRDITIQLLKDTLAKVRERMKKYTDMHRSEKFCCWRFCLSEIAHLTLDDKLY